MKARADKAYDAANVESLVNPDNQVLDVQVLEVNVTEQDLTPWQRIYAEYNSSTVSLKEKYNHLLNKEILSKQGKDPYSLANIFKDIAVDNIKLAKDANTNQSLVLQYYNDAAIACHHGLSVIEKANGSDDLELQKLEKEIYSHLDLIQTDMVSVCRGKSELLQNISEKADLSNISKSGIVTQLRQETKEQLKNIEAAKANQENNTYIELTANVFKQVARGMEQYLAALYREAQDLLGTPPCDYTVIGLGSMALRQMTPYSDLECAILTANENYKQHDNPVVRNYFTNLSHLVHFKIINLGETIMPISAYNINLSEFVSPAVNFDLGGKTPLGRIEKDKPYELIQTVDMMLSYLKNSGKTTDHVDKNLASILQKVCFIYGNKELAKSYQEQAQEFLLDQGDNGRPNHEERAVKALSEGVEEIDYTQSILKPKKIEGNLKQFSLKTVQGKLFDVKQEIYRMPDRFIYNLGMLHGVQEESSWDTIDKLYEQGTINSEGANNLKKALSFATNLRLKTYSHYGYQKDSMDFAKTYEIQAALLSREVEKELTTVFKLSDEDLKEDGALFEYYYTTLELRDKLEAFCELKNLEEKKEFFKNNKFYSDDVGTKAQVYTRLLRYKDALKYQLKELEILKKLLGDEDLKIATSLNNIGVTCGELGKHEEALNYLKQALEIWKKFSGDEHPDVANSLNNIGCTYGNLGRHEEALSYLKQALEIRQQYLESNPLAVAQSLNNIGNTYGALGDHNKTLKKNIQALHEYKNALNYNTQALEIRKKSLVDADYPDIARSFNSIGNNYGDLGDYKEALKYQIEGLEARQKSLGNSHPDVANSLNNIAGTYEKLGHYNKVLEYNTKAWKIAQKSLGDNHPNTILCKHNISRMYCNLSMYQEALAELAGILVIYKKTNQQNKIPEAIAKIKKIKSLYEDSNELLDNIEQANDYNESSQRISNLDRVLNQFKECNNFEKSDVIDKKILQTLDLLVKAQTSLYHNSKKNKLEIRKILNDYKKEYDDLKKSIENKQVKLQEVEEYLAAQKQIQDEKSENVLLADKTLSILETNSSFEDMPEKANGAVRVISYNITADFFDNKDATIDQRHHWKYRAPFVKVLLKTLYPDIICLQELSAEQAFVLHQYLNREGGYQSIFLSQTPSEVETGAIVRGEEVNGWGNKFLGASLIGTFINKSFAFVKTGRFWLNEEPDLVPAVQDRGKTDKGFGNMNTYRAVLWAKVQLDNSKSLYIFNSHYPLSGDNKARFKCAELEMNKIQEISQGNAWVWVGDKNIIPTKDDNEQYNPQAIYDELTRHGKSIIQDGDNHHGPSTTWIGFTYDPYKNQVTEEGKFAESSKLDVIVSNLNHACSFHHPGAFDPVEFKLLPLTDPLTEEHNGQRYFASDHAVIGADFIIDNNP